MNALTTTVDNVIVGSKGSRRWAYGTKAMDMKTRIQIVKESEVIK